MVNKDEKYKFVDDLTVLEIIDLVSIVLTSYNVKQHIPSDVSVHNKCIPPQNLKSQEWLEGINLWTASQKMQINSSKTKKHDFQFHQ